MKRQEEIDQAFTLLIESVCFIREDKLNAAPSPEGWTAGQVVDHILIATEGLPQFLHQENEPTHREKDQHEASIRQAFLDFSTKMTTPDFLTPPADTAHTKHALLERLEKLRLAIIQAAETADLSATCKGFALPGWGYLTGYEWLVFTACHVKRHTYQLNNINKHWIGVSKNMNQTIM